jgi:hypothetical protein
MATVPLTYGSVNISIRAMVADLATPMLYLGDDFLMQAWRARRVLFLTIITKFGTLCV